MLFLTDNVKEVDAAVLAGMQYLLVNRPGNAPLSVADRSRLAVVESLEEIDATPSDAENERRATEAPQTEVNAASVSESEEAS